MRSGRRNNAGIGIYIVIGIVSDVRTKKMLLIGEREEMAKNAGIGIEFWGKKLFRMDPLSLEPFPYTLFISITTVKITISIFLG